MTSTVSAETQKLYEELVSEFGDRDSQPYEDGTGRADGYHIILYKAEELVTVHYGDDGGMPFGGGTAYWIGWNGERAELEIDEDALWPCSFEQKQMFEKVREVREARNSHAVRMADDCYAGCWAIPGTSGNSDGLLHWWADWDEDGTACEKYPSKAGYPRKAGWTGMIVHKPKAGYCLECMRIYEGDTLPVEICGTWIVTMMGVNATG